MPRLTAEIITAAIEGFESQKARIDQQIAELRAMPPSGAAETAARQEGYQSGEKRSAYGRAGRQQFIRTRSGASGG